MHRGMKNPIIWFATMGDASFSSVRVSDAASARAAVGVASSPGYAASSIGKFGVGRLGLCF